MKARALRSLLALALVAFGGLCLNYTNAWNLEHHTEWSSERGLPAPNHAIFFGGIAFCVFGGALLATAFRRPAN